VALAAHLLGDRQFVVLRTYFAQLVTLGQYSAPDPIALLTSVEIVLGSLLVAYVPLTHMSHFFMKWFTYHHVRWADEPNLPGSDIERRVNEVLQYPVSWSAPHIRGDGKKTWVDVATSGVEEETGEKNEQR
jgi:nitrate reductase gamma subunit